MKKSLLFLASLLLSMASFAQRQKPVPATVDTYEYSTFEADGKGDTIVYYLYNKGAGGFFTEGNAWGTQASLGNTGLKVAITKYIAPSEEEGFDSEWDGATVFINDYSIAKGAWKLLFIESEEAAYVDRGSQANYFWEIKSQGGGIFRLKGAAINPDFNGDRFFGMSYYSDSETTILTPYIDLTVDNTAFVDWQFVTEAAYATYSEQIAEY